MDSDKTSLFPLPETQLVETLTVQLDGGDIVERSPRQLVALQSGSVPPLIPSAGS